MHNSATLAYNTIQRKKKEREEFLEKLATITKGHLASRRITRNMRRHRKNMKETRKRIRNLERSQWRHKVRTGEYSKASTLRMKKLRTRKKISYAMPYMLAVYFRVRSKWGHAIGFVDRMEPP